MCGAIPFKQGQVKQGQVKQGQVKQGREIFAKQSQWVEVQRGQIAILWDASRPYRCVFAE
jgi:hypothetical protein